MYTEGRTEEDFECPLYLTPLKQSLLLNLELGRQVTRPSHSLVSAFHSSGTIGTQPAFYVGAGDLNSGSHVSWQVLFFIEPPPQLNIEHLTLSSTEGTILHCHSKNTDA